MNPTSYEPVGDGRRELHSEPFRYMTVAGDNGCDCAPPGNGQSGITRAEIELLERKAYEQGAKEGEARATSGYQIELTQARTAIGTAISEFKTERETYFKRIEPEVVQLALAIARKILHREAQMDPLLLTGMVHVALEKLDSGTCVRMRVNPEDVHAWNEYFLQPGSIPRIPELAGDVTLQPGECAIETEIGSTIISLDTQLKEIEQGFFDLLEQRPQVR